MLLNAEILEFLYPEKLLNPPITPNHLQSPPNHLGKSSPIAFQSPRRTTWGHRQSRPVWGANRLRVQSFRFLDDDGDDDDNDDDGDDDDDVGSHRVSPDHLGEVITSRLSPRRDDNLKVITSREFESDFV